MAAVCGREMTSVCRREMTAVYCGREMIAVCGREIRFHIFLASHEIHCFCRIHERKFCTTLERRGNRTT